MRVIGFVLRVYRFPIPELVIAGLTALLVVSSSTTAIYLGTRSVYETVVSLSALPKFAAVVALSVFLWEFISMVRSPLINTILSLPISRLDLYLTYLVGSIALPLTIVAIPVIVTYLTLSPSLSSDLAIAMLSVLANTMVFYSIASTVGILTKSRGLAVGLTIGLWLALPIAATLLMIEMRGIAEGLKKELTSGQLFAIACLDPSATIHYAAVRNMDVGSILLGSSLVDLATALVLIIATGYIVVRRWEPT